METIASDYRAVFNTFNKQCIISGVRKPLDAVLNCDAGLILSYLAEDIITITEVAKNFKEFYEVCCKNEWIKNGKINYSFSKIDSEYHLKRIQIELTRLCNLKCSYCYSTSGPDHKTILTYDKVIEFIDDAYDLGCIWIDFTGGEPLVFNKWKEVMSYATQKGMVCSVHTNGTLLNERNVDKLKQIGIRQIQTSLDSHIAEVHDLARQRVGAYDATIAGIKRCQAIGLPVKVSVVAHQGNKDHYVETVNYLLKTLGTKVLIDRVIKAGREISHNGGLTTQEYFELVEPLVHSDAIESRVCDNFVTNDFKVEPYCGVAHSFVYITAEGEYALCPTMTTKDDPILFKGPSMANYSLKEAWLYSDYMLKYRGLNCRNTQKCPTAKECGGGCRSNAYIDTGDLKSPDFLSCNKFKNFTKKYVDFATIYNSTNLNK